MGDRLFRVEHMNLWVKNCFIFTKNRSVGMKKLMNISEEKKKRAIYANNFKNKYDDLWVEFDDGETWKVMRPGERCLGIRWDKCYVDASSVTISELERVIKPRGLVNNPDYLEYFNW